jgi:hypothetical protein
MAKAVLLASICWSLFSAALADRALADPPTGKYECSYFDYVTERKMLLRFDLGSNGFARGWLADGVPVKWMPLYSADEKVYCGYRLGPDDKPLHCDFVTEVDSDTGFLVKDLTCQTEEASPRMITSGTFIFDQRLKSGQFKCMRGRSMTESIRFSGCARTN